jgi:hypothetical protein
VLRAPLIEDLLVTRVALALLSLAAGCSTQPQLPAADSGPPPSRGQVVWESNREDGRREIYLMQADGSGVRRLTHGGATQAQWSPDGRWISYGELVDGSAHLMRGDGSDDRRLSSGQPMWWMHDGSGLVVREGDGYWLVIPETSSRSLLFNKGEFLQIGDHMLAPWPGGGGMTHDGRWLVAGTDLYGDGHVGDNGSFKASFAAVVLDLHDKARVYFFGSGCWPVTPPSGELIYHVCGECVDHPDLARMSLADLATRSSYALEVSHPDPDWGHEYNPHISSDGQWIVYMASTGCHSGDDCDYEIFLHRLGAPAQERTRLTSHPSFDGYPDLFVP